MKKLILLFCLICSIIGCNSKDPGEQLKNLDGYWEIDRVELSEDSIRIYRFSESVDYFELENGKGFRKKVRPQLDGSYQVTEDAEKVEAKIENGDLTLYYSTPFDSWKEKVIDAGEKNLSIETDAGIIYHYKRYKPLLEDEKE